MNWKVDFCRHFSVFFQDHNEFSTFSLTVFPGLIFCRMKTAVYSKHRQVLPNIKRSLLRKFSVLQDKKLSTENRDIPLEQKIFRNQKTLVTQKGSPTKLLVLWEKNWRKTWYPVKRSCWIPKTSRNTKKAPSRGFSRRKKFSTSFCDT